MSSTSPRSRGEVAASAAGEGSSATGPDITSPAVARPGDRWDRPAAGRGPAGRPGPSGPREAARPARDAAGPPGRPRCSSPAGRHPSRPAGPHPGASITGGGMITPPAGGAFIAGDARFSRSMLPSRMIARIVPAPLRLGDRVGPGSSRVETTSSAPATVRKSWLSGPAGRPPSPRGCRRRPGRSPRW